MSPHYEARSRENRAIRLIGPALLPILAFALLIAGCGEETPPAFVADVDPTGFPNVLDLSGTPSDDRDLSNFAFADLGAWHMFGVPDVLETERLGGFTGPLLLTDRARWLGSSFIRLDVIPDGSESSGGWSVAPDSEGAASYPGSLRQSLVQGSVAVSLDLIFASNRSAVVRAEVVNEGASSERVTLRWSGSADLVDASVEVDGDGVVARLSESSTTVDVRFSPTAEDLSAADGSHSARTTLELLPGETVTHYALVSAYFDDEERISDAPRRGEILSDLPGAFDAHHERWSTYLSKALASIDTDGVADADDRRRLAVKAVQTLVSNWRGATGDLYHDGLFPSFAYRGFHGVWAWDSWKHARALAIFAPEVAKDQMRVMFDLQNERGMVPDVIYRDSASNNWRNTKPPLAGWAVHGIFAADADTAFIAEIFDDLDRYHQWWYADRDQDGDQLAEYGSTDGTLIAAAWESGMDNAVRFDSSVVVQTGEGAWSLDQESVDLNAYLYAEKLYLADLAEAIGRSEVGEAYRASADALGEMIRGQMFDSETNYFYDTRVEDDSFITVPGPEGWIPLWAGVATEEQAAGVAAMMMNPETFNGVVPLPTLSMNRVEFDPTDGYWRGPVWLDQAYFGVAGLRRYGMDAEADQLLQSLMRGPEGLLEDAPIHENYDPRTGAGLNAPHFSWSAAHYLMLLGRSD